MKLEFPLTPPPLAGPRKRRLGEILLDAGLLTQEQLLSALAEQRKWGGRLGHTLVQLGYVNEGAMAHALSHQLQLPTVDLDEHEPSAPVASLLPVELAERYGVFPLCVDEAQQALTLATSDPTHPDAFQELTAQTGRQVYVMVSSASAIERAIRLHYHGELPMAAPAGAPPGAALGFRASSGEELEPLMTPAPGHSSASMVPLAPRVSATSREAGAREAELAQRVEDLVLQVEDLRRMVASQARAIHNLMELLEERGLVNRAEYLARVRG